MTLAEKVYLHSLARKEAADLYYNQLVSKYAADNKQLAIDLGIDAAAGAGAAGATYGGYKGLGALAKAIKPYTDSTALVKYFGDIPLKDVLVNKQLRGQFIDALIGKAAQTGGAGNKIRAAAAGLGRLNKYAKGGILGGAALGAAGLTHLLRKTAKKEDKGILSKLGLA